MTQYDENIHLKRAVIPDLEMQIDCMYDGMEESKRDNMKRIYNKRYEMEFELEKLLYQNG